MVTVPAFTPPAAHLKVTPLCFGHEAANMLSSSGTMRCSMGHSAPSSTLWSGASRSRLMRFLFSVYGSPFYYIHRRFWISYHCVFASGFIDRFGENGSSSAFSIFFLQLLHLFDLSAGWTRHSMWDIHQWTSPTVFQNPMVSVHPRVMSACL